jgi:hypothetical protein
MFAVMSATLACAPIFARAQQAAYPVGRLPTDVYRAKHAELSIAVVQLAAVDDEAIPTRQTIGVAAHARTWVTATVGVDASIWAGRSTSDRTLWGAQAGGAFVLTSDSARARFVVAPHVGLVARDGEVLGGGCDVALEATLHAVGPITPFIAVGIIGAVRSLDAEPAPGMWLNEVPVHAKWGYGPYAELGGSVDLWGSMRLTGDVTAHVQVSMWEMSSYLILAGRVGVAMDFR